ncbi:hypothetical protein EOM81_10065 [bacterium]|nr:hypothetical protein [bacterium]
MESLCITVKEFQKLTGISEGAAYNFARSELVPKIRKGRRIFLVRQGVTEILNNPDKLNQINKEINKAKLTI